MKNLSKALVLVLAVLLTPGAVQAIEWCTADNQNIWTYFSGQTPYTFNCNDIGTATITQAAAYAEAKCQHKWDTFASNYAFDGPTFQLYYTEIGNTNICRWKYRCKGCVLGFLPHIWVEPRPAVLGPADAGNVAANLVKGLVMAIEISDDGDDEADKESYLVDVLTETRMVQVVVDATTGRAEIVTDDEPVGCQP